MSKRPWKKHACIHRVELNNGDVKFETAIDPDGGVYRVKNVNDARATFETLDDAVAHLDKWWADFWPVQVKSRERA